MRARMATLVVACVLLTACSSTQPTPGTDTTAAPDAMTAQDPTAGTPAPDPAEETVATSTDAAVVVEATAALGTPAEPGLDADTQGLAVRYTVRNSGSEAVLVARERGHTQDSGTLGPRNDESVWIRVEDGVLVLSKELLPLPSGLVEEAETTLAADLLEPGGSLDGTAFALRPLEVTFPRAVDKGALVDPLPARWRLCLTVAPVDRRSDVIGRLDQGQELVCSEPGDLPDELATP